MTALGRLERVDLRAAWSKEALHFTPWLASAENISLLAETLGFGADAFEVEGVERQVGPFRADILCRDVISDELVLIENQLEKTDHSHLGQIVTYAAGLEAKTVIWISARVVDEHRAAVNWLNEITSPDYRFFAVEVELWRIADSAPAPKFEVVAAPNDWSRRASAGARRILGGSGGSDDLLARYWAALDQGPAAGMASRTGRAAERAWVGFALGVGQQRLMVRARPAKGRVDVELYIKRQKTPTLFEALEARRSEIEEAFGASLLWQGRPGGSTAGIIATLPAEIENEADWPRQHMWIAEQVRRFRSVLGPEVAVVLGQDQDNDA